MAEKRSRRRRIRKQFVVVAALFLINFIEMGVVKSFGVLVDDLVFQLNSDLGTIGIVIGIYYGITYFTAPFISPFVQEMSVFLLSGVCVVGSLSLSIASLTTDVIQLTAVFLLSGFCYSFVRLSGVTLFYRNVQDNFSVTFGIADSGNAIGMIVLPVLTEFLLQVYGWSGTILLFGGFLLHNAILLLLMGGSPDEVRGRSRDDSDAEELLFGTESIDQSGTIDSELEDDVFDPDGINESRQSDDEPPGDSSLLGCCRCVYHTFGLSLFCEISLTPVIMFYMVVSGIINAAWIVFLIPHGVAKGFPLSRAVFLASCGGFGNVIGRVAQGPIVDRGWLSSMDLTIILTIANSVVFLLDPLTSSFAILCVGAFVGGLTIGARTTLSVVMVKEFFPPEFFSAFYGLQCLFYSIGEPLGGLLAGWLADELNFSFAFLVLGAIEVITCLVLIPTRYFMMKQQQPGQSRPS